MPVPDRDSVHQALGALYDNLKLSQAAIVACFPRLQRVGALDERAEALRSLLLEALDSLRPRHRLPFGAPESRSYDALRLRYLERLRISAIEEELSIGRRQVFRDLEEAEDKLAEVLGSWVGAGEGDGDGPARPQDSLSDELLALVGDPGQVNLVAVVQEACAVVQPLAEAARMQLQPRLAGTAVGYVVADAAILKQVLVQLLCCAVQEALTAPEVEVRLEDDSASIVVTFSGGLDAVRDRRVADAQRIALSQGMACDVESASGTTSLRLRLARGRPVTVLVVEDNPGAVELYRRYLSPRGWQVQSVSDPRQAVEAAREARPDVILLDIMMPRLDGWSVLQALRTQGETASTPVVVCSIVEQPELAASLGASACLTKPVSQGELVSTLSRCLAGVGR